MPRSGGTYTLPSGNPVISGTVIRSAWANTTMSDIAAALTGSIARDGQSAPTANLPMGGFRLTNVGVGAALTDLARISQVQDGSLLRCTAEANVSDAFTANLPFGATSFVNGQQIVLIWPAANTTTSPTLNINGSAAWPVLREDGSSIQVGDFHTGVPSILIWNSTSWLLTGTTGGGGGGSGVSSFNSRLGAVTLLSGDVTSALGYTPLNRGGDSMTGALTLAGDAATALQPVTLQQLLATIASLPSVAGVQSFNSRTGVVTLTSTDVTNALTFSPVQTFNGRTGTVTLTSSDVTTALTFSPVQTFNTRTGNVTLTSGDVTTALGFTPQAQLGTFSYVFATKSADVAVTGGAAAAKVTFTNEITDVLNEFASSRFTASVTGTYHISAVISYDITAGTSRENDLFIYKNGTALLTQRGSLYDTGNNSTSITATLQLSASDYIEIFFAAFHSGTLQGGTAPYISFLTIARII